MNTRYDLYDLYDQAMKDNIKNCLSESFFGTSTVGERGQVVIPAEAREEFNIQPGDKLMVMRHPVHPGVMLFKIDSAREFLDEFQKTLDRIEKDEEGRP
ncbi:MAG: AbrB/MazE/SpoVT family DNA-binding domain-containing protein [Chlorobia bacterium]|nr:AbrB/MazE/SpoVT family DNA-binding domain-containing protein [Fimbriimonadaceae bacterium]